MAIFQFNYTELNNDKELTSSDYHLLSEAKRITEGAYAPYSKFKVGASVLLKNGKIILGVNIENASYPVGICAERSALASAISQFPEVEIEAIAISYLASKGENDKPVFPCGMCRQFISECEDRNQSPIRLILGAQNGKVILLETSKNLLPFSFTGADLG
jgi:cytidine deaminase